MPVVGDTLDEPDETFTRQLDGATNATIADGQGMATIRRRRRAALRWTTSRSPRATRAPSTATFTVSLSQPSGRTVTVNYATADGTATQPSDYRRPRHADVRSGPDVEDGHCDVIGDTAVEPDETFNLNLGSSNASIADGVGVGTIANDDVVVTARDTIARDQRRDGHPEGNSGANTAVLHGHAVVAALSAVTSTTGPGTARPRTRQLHGRLRHASRSPRSRVEGDRHDGQRRHGAGTRRAVQRRPVVAVGRHDRRQPRRRHDINDDSIGGGGSVGSGDLFCGTQHRGKCNGLKVKDEFDRPGNASWVFAAYNPLGNSNKGRAAASKPIVLTRVRKRVRAGVVNFRVRLKPGAKTKKLYKHVRRAHFKGILITRTFVPADGGAVQTINKSVKLKP